MSNIRIEPEKWYSLTDMVQGNVFPWISSDIRNYRRVINIKKHKSILKGHVEGEGAQKRYYFKGEHIIAFRDMIEQGKI